MDKFEKWKQNLPPRQRREVDKRYRAELKGLAVDEAKKKIELTLAKQMEHDRIVGKVALLFIEGGKIAEETHCRFVTYDPLIELGKKTADLLIFEPEKRTALVVEVKTDGSPVSDLGKSKDVVESNLGHLENVVDSQEIGVIYILIVNSFGRATELKRECIRSGFALGYIEGGELKLHSGCPTNIEQLDSILFEGTRLLMGDSVYIMLGSHHFHILSNTLVKISREKLRDARMSGEKIDTKEFTFDEFVEAFQDLAYISSVESGSSYEKYIRGKLEDVMREGLRSGVIVETSNRDTYRIYTQARVSIGKITETMKGKYIDWYVETNKERIAEENVYGWYLQKYESKQRKLDVR